MNVALPFLMNKGKTLDRRIKTLSLESACTSCIHLKSELHLNYSTSMEGYNYFK